MVEEGDFDRKLDGAGTSFSEKSRRGKLNSTLVAIERSLRRNEMVPNASKSTERSRKCKDGAVSMTTPPLPYFMIDVSSCRGSLVRMI